MSLFLRLSILVLLAASPLLAPSPTFAQTQQRQGIAAIVNDDVISLHDLDSRLTLVLVTSRLPDTPENRQRLAPEVLRSLIDEALKRQEMRKQNITVSQADLDRGLLQVSQQLRVQPNEVSAYLEQQGVRMATLIEQLEAEIGWIKSVQKIAGDRATVTRSDVDEELARVRSTGVEFRLSEIFLSVDDPADQGRVEEQARRLVTEARTGANFAALARSFSQGPSAGDGGDLGWVNQDDLDEQIARVVAGMQPGQVSDPIRGQGGYFVLFLAGSRSSEGTTGTRIKLMLQQVYIPLPTGAQDAVVAAQASALTEMARNSPDCPALADRARSIGAQVNTSPGPIDIQQMPVELRQMVAPLPKGGTSQPVRTSDGVLVLMVCDRQEEAADDQQRQQIERRLRDQRLAAVGRRQLRDLRRSALVDVRI
ncbi:MAG: peptidylprolyl isomerase [Rhodospirillales bacterium]|nr:peptidylprolyl isomerase [Rhodospirillales bacterium]